MANNYCQSSSMLYVPKIQLAKAREIVERVVLQLEEVAEECCGCNVELDDDGVWFSHDESINPDHVEIIARALVEELEIDEPFYCSWSYTCSKPRIDEFGGGAFVLKRGYETYWVDAMEHVHQQVKHGGLTRPASSNLVETGGE